jgi:hypothetical protein
MRYGISLVALLFVLSVGAAASAQGRGNGHAKAASPSTQGKSGVAKAGKKPAAGKKPTTAVTAGTDVEAKAKPPKAPKAKEIARTSTTPVTPPTPVTPTTPTTLKMKNPKLEARLLAMIPNLPVGSTIQDVSSGFKNWGQFVAAVHVSNNLNIPFADLKARMTGLMPGTVPGTVVQTTPMSLGQAIQSFHRVTKPETPETAVLTPTKIRNEVKKAEDAANADLRSTRASN